MIVCLCHRVSERDMARQVFDSCTSFDQLQDDLREATDCGACLANAKQVFMAARSALATGREDSERRTHAVCAA